MTQWLKQSTAVTIKMGPFVDETDGKTPETLLTIAQADIRLSKNGGAFAQTNNVAGATHDENGEYGVPLDTTDTNTLGRLKVEIQESGALPVWQEFMIVPEAVWDALFGAGNLVVTLDDTEDVYHADIQFTRDQANTTDEWTVTWYRNGVATAPTGTPTIQIVKRVDGTDLVAAANMTQIGATSSFKYDEATNRITVGEAVIAIAAATVNGGARTFRKLIGRDST